jgi:hypothetical protein
VKRLRREVEGLSIFPVTLPPRRAWRVAQRRAVRCRAVRRLRRILLNVATVLSLLLFVSSTAIWIRSQWVADVWSCRVVRHGPSVEERAICAVTRGRALALSVITHTFMPEVVWSGPGLDPSRVATRPYRDAYLRTDLPAGTTLSHRTTDPDDAPAPAGRPNRFGFLWERFVSDPLPRRGELVVDGSKFRVGVERINGEVYQYVEDGTSLALPWWLLTLLFSVLPLNSGVRRWRRGRPAPGLCLKCGYDLRATPDRCPECGQVATGR